MVSARGFEHAIGWVVSLSGRATTTANAIVICDSTGLPELVSIAGATARDLSLRRAWRTSSIATSPVGLALPFPDHAVAIFRRSATELHLISTPYEAMPDEEWQRLEAASAEHLDHVSLPSGVVAISALDEDVRGLAAALPTPGTASAQAVGVTGEGALVRVDPGEYALSHARYEADEDVFLDLYRLRRTDRGSSARA